MGHDFPLEGMQEAYENGKIVELTYQIVGGAYDRNPNFDVLDGLKDDEIRRFAKQAKEFGHPFLFRLNNEMNSTWVSYSGHLSLCDPDIFVQVWRRVYDLFQEAAGTALFASGRQMSRAQILYLVEQSRGC
jgi:beta-mannanase